MAQVGTELVRQRYQVHRRLGKGGGGSVFEVTDLLSGARVALKALWPGAHDRALVEALRGEFSVLATVRHPRLCRVYDFGRLPADSALPGAPESGDRGGYFLTRELVDGDDLAASCAGRELAQVCATLADAARGLEVLHAAGIRHGDFKPANAIVGPDGAVRLIDFGLAIEESAHRSAGTLAYMAPEILAHRAVDRRADLYALGVSLFQLASGALPSGARRGADLIDWHLRRERPSLAAAVPGCPPAVDRLCAQLMASVPDDRLPTAAEAAAALEACAAELGGEVAPVARAPLIIPALPMPQVAALERVFETRRWGKGGPAVAMIVGDAGAGKSTVLTELAWRAELAGAEVVRAAGAAAGRPFGLFGQVLEQVAALTGREPPVAPGQGGETQHAHSARIAAFLAEAARAWPLVVLIDDLDYADAGTRDLVRYLGLAMPDDARVLIVAARRGDGDTGRAASRVGEIPTFALAPLSAGDIAGLLARVAGRRDDALAARIVRHTGGNLLHVVHTLEVLAGRGFPAAESLDAFGLPPRLEEELADELGRMAPEVRAVCEAVALLGRPASPALVGAALDREADAVEVAAGETELATRDAAGRIALVRPALALALEQAMAPDRRAALHGACAAALAAVEDRGPSDPERVVHLVRAGDRDAVVAAVGDAVTALRAAGDGAGALALGRSALALAGDAVAAPARLAIGEVARAYGDVDAADLALTQLAGGPLSDATARRARFVLGQAREEAGQPERAEPLWQQLIDGAAASAEAALAARELSRYYIKRGRYDDALAVVDDALAAGGAAAVRAHLEVARLFAAGTLGRQDGAAGELEEAGRVAAEAGDHQLAQAAFNYAALLWFRAGDYRATRSGYQRALEAATLAGDLVRVGTLRMNIASLAFHQGDYAGCLEQHVAAVSMLRAAGADTSLVLARRNLGHLLVELGEYEQARAELSTALATAEAIGFRIQVAGVDALRGIADCRTGDPRRGIARLERAQAAFEGLGDRHRVVETLLDIADCALDAGDEARAARALEAAADGGADSAGQSRRARFLGLDAELAARRGDSGRADDRLAALADSIDELRAGGARHALWALHRSAGRARAALGDDTAADADRRAALAILDEMAAGLPDAHRAAFWHDPRRRELRRVRSAPSEMLAATDVATGPVTSPRADRLRRLLDIYRRMSTERDVDRLLEMVMDTAVELSGAERGFLLLAGDDGALRTAAARNLPPATRRALAEVDADPTRSAMSAVPYSRTVAERAFHDGEVVLSNEPQADPRFEAAQSVHALHLESVVCLPVSLQGRVVGVLYLESRFRRAPFTDDDLELLFAFADQVAVLLDNARLLEENSRRARELERAQIEIEGLLAERTALLEARTEELAHVRRDLAAVRRRFLADRGAFGIIGRSPAMEKVFELIERLAATDVPVMVLGESGTGKELVARALHEYGPRKEAPMVSVNCGALPEQLLESELFGHVRGAFTGADRDRRGLFETATRGTLFLDEVGETPARMQATLLRALQEGVIRRVGGLDDIRVDVRVVTATNRDLEEMVAAGSFREDLYYRLQVVPIQLPPLRERADDIPLLAEHFLELICERTGLGRKSIAPAAMRSLMSQPWPGNVRQLEHAITNAAVMAEGDVLGEDDFASVLAGPGAVRAAPPSDPEKRRLRDKQRILDALEATGWNKSKAARMLQIPRRTFYRRLHEFGIQ